MSSIKMNIQISPQDLFTSNTIAQTDLGAYGTTGDGRGFRYVQAGAVTLQPGKVQANPAQDTTNYNPSGGLAVGAAAAGTYAVTLTGSLTIAANALAGGFMSIAVTPGQGYTYKIKGNTAVTAATGCVVTLEDPLLVALTTSSKVVMTVSPFSNTIVNPATASGAPTGVAVFAIPNAQYGWIQTHGPVSLLNDGGTAVGLGLCPSAATAGAAKTQTATGSLIGYALTTQVTTEYDMAFLTID